MAIQRYKVHHSVDGNQFFGRLVDVQLPSENYKYVETVWNDDYTWSRLSNRIYGNPDDYWLIMIASGLTNSYLVKNGDRILFLRPEYLNEIVVL